MKRSSRNLAIMLGIGLHLSAFAGSAMQGAGDGFYLEPDLGSIPPIKAGDPVEGATATIHKNMSGITVNIHIDNLNPNHVYSVWLVDIDRGCPLVYLTGHAIGKSGEGQFNGHISTSADDSTPVVNPISGEYHAIIADHGPLEPELLPEDIKTVVPPLDPMGALNWPMV